MNSPRIMGSVTGGAMNSIKHPSTLLSTIAVLLLGILVGLLWSRRPGIPFELVQPAFAQADQSSSDVVFYPWINPRRFVFWDRQNGLIYIYDAGGNLDATWVVGKLGERLTKK